MLDEPSTSLHTRSDTGPMLDGERRAIVAQAEALACATHSAFPEESETRRLLNAHGLPDEEIERQLSTLRANTAGSTGVLTTYSLLHSLHHLDAIAARSPQLSPTADCIVSLFRCAEICLHNMEVLATRATANLDAGRFAGATSNLRWRNGFQEVLYRLSALVVEVADDPSPGASLDLRDSAVFAGYRRATDELHRGLTTRWSEEDADVFAKDLDDPVRFVSFSEYASTSDERIWVSRLRNIRLPGVEQQPGESAAAFYERVVCGSELVAMMEALETEADTDLLPFRAVHQVAELIAALVNRRLCALTSELVGEGELQPSSIRLLVVSNRLLGVVDDVTRLLLRALTPRAYRDVRSNLGMVRGTSSIVLRQTLFNRTYPLLVRAVRLRLAGFDTELAADDDAVRARGVALLAGTDPEREVVVQLVVLHQHIRTWRDNHQQFPKTHLGVSPDAGRPTVSLSGSESAVDIAHSLRGTHAGDPVAPLYEAALGTTPPDVHELLTPGGFDEHMAHRTARAVFEVYEEVQERFYERARRRAEPTAT